MLIENIDIELTLLAKISGGGVTSTSGAGDIKVLSVDTVHTINGLPSAQISIVVEKNKSVLGTRLTELKKKDFVGTTLKVIWNPGNKYSSFTMFEGIVSGVGISKSINSVQYSVACTGGPTAMYNTTVATSPWFPFGNKDPAALSELFNDVLLNEDSWKTPKELLELLIQQLPEAISSHYTNETSDAEKNHYKLAQAFLEVDRQTLREPQILQQFFGTVGSNEEFDEPIRRRIFELVSRSGSTSTYWDILTQVAKEIGCYIVPWVNTTLILPHMLFSNAIRANVFFPSMLNSVNMQSDPLDYPDQVVVYAEDDFVSTDVSTMSTVLRSQCVVFPEEVDLSEFSPYPSKSYKFLYPPKYAPWIRKSAWLNKDFSDSQINADESRQDYTEDTATLQEAPNKWKEYCKNFAEFQYHKLRSENDSADVSSVFHPVAVPGFTGYILDGETGTNYRGLLLSVGHSISEQSAGTSLKFSNLVPLNTADSGQNLTIESPLWLQLLPEGANVGPETLAADSARDGGLSAIGASHVSFEEVLNHPAMEDAEQAALFTSRL